VVGQNLFFVFINAPRIYNSVPGRRVIKSVSSDVAGIAVVINLANTRREVAVALKKLWQRDYVRQRCAEMLS